MTAGQPAVGVRAGLAAENAATVADPDKVTGGSGVTIKRGLPFGFRADRPTATGQFRAMQQGSPANEAL